MSPSHLLGNACHDNDAYHISDAYAISHTLISQTASLLDESLLAYMHMNVHLSTLTSTGVRRMLDRQQLQCNSFPWMSNTTVVVV